MAGEVQIYYNDKSVSASNPFPVLAAFSGSISVGATANAATPGPFAEGTSNPFSVTLFGGLRTVLLNASGENVWGTAGAQAASTLTIQGDPSGTPIPISPLPSGSNNIGKVTLADSAAAEVLGTVTASPTANTVLGRLKDLLSLTVLAAGSNLIGKVSFDQTTPGTTDSVSVKGQGYSAVVSQARTSDTNAYAGGDVVGAAPGSTAALTFPSMGPGSKEVIITSVALEIDIASIPSGMTSFRLYLYNVTPPSALGDNVAWDLPSGDRASFLGYIDLGSPVDLGSTLYVETNSYNKQISIPANGSLYGYLVTNGAYTPGSGDVFKVTLHSAAM